MAPVAAVVAAGRVVHGLVVVDAPVAVAAESVAVHRAAAVASAVGATA